MITVIACLPLRQLAQENFSLGFSTDSKLAGIMPSSRKRIIKFLTLAARLIFTHSLLSSIPSRRQAAISSKKGESHALLLEHG
jgi:hypothetical protein